MKKQTRVIVFSLLFLLLVIALCFVIVVRKEASASTTLSTFEDTFLTESKDDEIIYPLGDYLVKTEEEELTYQFSDDFYMNLSYNSNKEIKRVYYYVKKELYEKDSLKKYLRILVQSMNPNYSSEQSDDVVLKMIKAMDKKADEVGFLTEFQQDSKEYIVMEKGEYLQFFIYQEHV